MTFHNSQPLTHIQFTFNNPSGFDITLYHISNNIGCELPLSLFAYIIAVAGCKGNKVERD